ncbi:hypothetical protein [Chryseobacterium potabilaquae]|uniref:Uncharacterized protein n=1 Tax=Chryseobacterium potabilaquae TaxID=2675057 RepID=A0A6N4X5D6_9FLAO|nr:hypothetical protein [Chryseobacterium potabilaquae]CAA7193996.1 hypothetical protein CHRY9293_00375 [Chryseobacterium potabilaquae]
MGGVLFLIFFGLILSLFLSKIKKGRLAEWAKLFRTAMLIFTISLFSYWFIKKSTVRIIKDSVALQIINKLPQTLDFYVISNKGQFPNGILETKHIGKIRPEYYRIEYLKMDSSDEYWIIGNLGKKNLVYFSQHSVPNKNIDQMIEVRNYINQSVKLSDIAKKQIESYSHENIKQGIWITLDFLLLFLNLVLLVRRR